MKEKARQMRRLVSDLFTRGYSEDPAKASVYLLNTISALLSTDPGISAGTSSQITLPNLSTKGNVATRVCIAVFHFTHFTSDRALGSLENIHDQMHVTIGGNGHMS